MNYRVKNVLAAIVLSGVGTVSYAQYPTIPPDVQRSADSLLNTSRIHSDEAWASALPIIKAEAKQGKPYIPFAAKPDDLPQADIPAFPGAQNNFSTRGERENASQIACSRPPEPITKTFMFSLYIDSG